jgi:hypothetical protein
MERNMTIEDRIERIQTPGHGYGHGCTVVARRDGETNGVKWTRITVTDNSTDVREQIYMTESGWQIERLSNGQWFAWLPGQNRSRTHSTLTRAFNRIASSESRV